MKARLVNPPQTRFEQFKAKSATMATAAGRAAWDMGKTAVGIVILIGASTAIGQGVITAFGGKR